MKPPTHNTKFVIIYTKVGGKPSSLSLASTFMLVDDTLFVDTRCCFNFVIMLCTVLDKLDQYLPHVSRCVYINIYICTHRPISNILHQMRNYIQKAFTSPHPTIRPPPGITLPNPYQHAGMTGFPGGRYANTNAKWGLQVSSRE